MGTVKPNPAKPPCTRCGGVWFAKGLCRKCYWDDYNAAHPERCNDYNHTKRKGRKRKAPKAPERHRCKNRWCKKLLEVMIDRTGSTVTLPCELCSRFERGLCYTCGKPLRETDVFQSRKPYPPYPSRWHMDKPNGCYWIRRRAMNASYMQIWRERHPEERHRQDQARGGPRYAKERRDVLRFNKRLRKDSGKRPYRAKKKVAPCPEPGCTNMMSYTTCPPKRCDPCWDRLALARAGGDA